MSKFRTLLTRYRKEEDGASLAEYGVTFIVIALAGTIGLAAIGTNLNTAFTSISTWIQTNVTGKFGG